MVRGPESENLRILTHNAETPSEVTCLGLDEGYQKLVLIDACGRCMTFVCGWLLAC